MSILKRIFGSRKEPVSVASQPSETAASTAASHGQPENLAQAVESAFGHQNAGRLQEAERIYEQVLAADSTNFNALHLLGVLYHQRGEHARAADKIEAALRVDPSNVPAHSNLGECYRALGRNADARQCYEKALALQPDWSAAAYNLGNLLQKESRFSEAQTCYENALRTQPTMVDAQHQLGNVLAAQRHFQEARQCYGAVLNTHPRHAACLVSLGNVLRVLGNADAAEDCYHRALAVDRNLLPAIIGLGDLQYAAGRFTEAKTNYEKAASLSAKSFEAFLGLARACAQLNLKNEACGHFEKALGLRPDSSAALHDLGNTLVDMGEQQAALDVYAKALSLAPDNALLRWLFTVVQLPALFPATGCAAAARSAFIHELQQLDAWFNIHPQIPGYEEVGVLWPFLLAYHDEANKDVLSQYGRLCARLMQNWPAGGQIASVHRQRPKKRSAEKISIGFVSAHVYDHSVWNAIGRGFVSHLNRAKIDVQVFYLGAHVDDETNIALSTANYFENGTKSWQQWAESISQQKPDVLIYPEIGMHAATAKLASLRLAPVQAASWGHPETSGLPTIDYYLSAEYLEPPNAQDYYTERLERLPNLGCFVDECLIESAPPDFTPLGVDASVPLLLCPGVPFKYLPENDHVLVDIARRVKQCQFIFFTHRLANLSVRLKQRLAGQFATAGLDADKFLVFIPWQQKAAFYGLMKRADVFLDTIGFSGFNTALQGLECGLPIVTREGRFMRGRLASGLLKRIGLSEFAAQSNQEYVDIATHLASDSRLRIATRERIVANRGPLFGDLEPVRALEKFIENAVSGG